MVWPVLISGGIGYSVSKVLPLALREIDNPRIPLAIRRSLFYLKYSYDDLTRRYPRIHFYSLALKDNLGLVSLVAGYLYSQKLLDFSYSWPGLIALSLPLLPIGLHYTRQMSYMRFPREIRPWIRPSSMHYNPYFPSIFAFHSTNSHNRDLYVLQFFPECSENVKQILEGTYEFWKEKQIAQPSIPVIMAQIQLIISTLQNCVEPPNLTAGVWDVFISKCLPEVIPLDLIKESSLRRLKMLLEVTMTEFQRLSGFRLDIQANLQRMDLNKILAKVKNGEKPDPDYKSLTFKLPERASWPLKTAQKDSFFKDQYRWDQNYILGIHAIISRFCREVLEHLNQGSNWHLD